MIIEEKLDFDDVLIRPKRSTLKSRKDVCVTRDFTTKYSGTIGGFPLIVANMDTTGTFAMSEALEKHNAFVALNKHYSVEELRRNWKSPYSFITFGMSEKDKEKINALSDVIEKEWSEPKICLDVANGYTEVFGDYVANIRERFPRAVIMAGNVCTPEMTEQLIIRGADIVKIGIGPGCFIAGTKITTKEGLKPIEKIKIGDMVLTHTGEFKEVTAIMSRKENEVIFEINNIKCTKNHEFYVLPNNAETTNILIFSDENFTQVCDKYAKWVPAEELSNKHILVYIDKPQHNTTRFMTKPIDTIKQYKPQNEIVYDITVKDNHSYCVNGGTVVHNSVCTTRITTGVGYPQLSAILECKDAAHGMDGLICADGGCKNAGDVAKAFGAGADFVMVGGLFAATDECDGEWEYTETVLGKQSKQFLKFYGMSSKEAQEKYNGGLQSHRASEGKCTIIPAKGPAETVLLDIIGGVRSACAYVGARRLKDFNKCCSFVRVSRTHNTVYGG